MGTTAENQEKLTALIQRGNAEKQKHDIALSDMVSARNRLEGIQAMLAAARFVLPADHQEFETATRMAREEALYWLRRYIEAVPEFVRARMSVTEIQVEIDVIEKELRVQLAELQAEKRAKGQVGNPPGAQPSIGLTS